MRSKTIVSLILVASSSVLASATTAQQPSQPLPGQQQQQSANPAVPGQRPMGPGGMGMGAGMMNPDMMRMLGPMFERSQDTGRRGGPLQRVSRLLAAPDDPRVRTALGLTDQQADSLRKIVVDTEIFTIKTGADIAVNSIELRELLRADKPDRAAVMSKGDQISKSTSLLINRYLDAMLAASAADAGAAENDARLHGERRARSPGPPAASDSPIGQNTERQRLVYGGTVGVQGRITPPKPSLKDGSYDAGQQNLTSAAHKNPPAAIDKPPLAALDRS